MKIAPLALLLLASSCASAATSGPGQTPPREPAASKLALSLGVRGLDKDDWDPVHNQPAFGLEYVHEKPTDFIGFEFALSASGARKEDEPTPAGFADIVGRTSEVSAGVHKTLSSQPGQASPYLGAGISWIRAEFKQSLFGGPTAEDSDSSPGVYVHGGVDFPLGPALAIGLDLRALGGTKVELLGQNGTADYVQLALVLAVRF